MSRVSLLSLAVVVAFPAAVAGQGTVPDRDRILTAAREVMVTARNASLVTIGEEGRPQARIVPPSRPTHLEIASPRHGLMNDPNSKIPCLPMSLPGSGTAISPG